ncbi:MAG: phosphodiesterase [Christensenellaceae bacterium]|jgi:putative phosphoesterase|nr:phosphodiesterase [Christensenellaceae bacterium]
MKYVIGSDVHGSLFYGRLLIERFIQEEADRLIILGDIYYHGPRNPFPEEYAPMLLANELNLIKEKLIVIKGNCDSEVDQMISEFKFIDSITIEFYGTRITCQHGHKLDLDNLPQGIGQVLLVGHTHEAFILKKGDQITANPGSVALPKSDSCRGYLVLTQNKLVLKNLESGDLITEKTF